LITDIVTKNLSGDRTDVNLSKELSEKFNEKLAGQGYENKSESHLFSMFAARLRKYWSLTSEHSLVDFTIVVGGSVNWPLSSKTVEFQTPRELQPLLDRFKGYYNNEHTSVPVTPAAKPNEHAKFLLLGTVVVS